MLSVHPMQDVVLQFCSIMKSYLIIRFTVNNICVHSNVFLQNMSQPLTNACHIH